MLPGIGNGPIASLLHIVWQNIKHTGVDVLGWGYGALKSIAAVDHIVPALLIFFSLVFFFPTTFFSKVSTWPYRFVLYLLRLIKVVHDRRTWGVVYDSVTKEPIDPAYVTVKNRLGVVIATAITDLDGRFGIIVPQGTYTLIVEKTNYLFPSARLVGKATDGYYTGLYFGNPFEVTTSERSLAFAIPLDPTGSDWNQLEKKRTHRKPNDYKEVRYGAIVYYALAGIFIGARAFVLQDDLSLQILLGYGFVLIVGGIYAFLKPATYYHSVVIDTHTREPLGFARIKIFNNSSHIQVATKITSFNGQFVCLIPNGTYYVTVERRETNGQYVLVHTSASFQVISRSINREFIV